MERCQDAAKRSKISVYTITERERVNRYVRKNIYDVVDFFERRTYNKDEGNLGRPGDHKEPIKPGAVERRLVTLLLSLI